MMAAHSVLDGYIAASFEAAKIEFFHAENLCNFSSYCAEGALVARAELIRQNERYTRFYSDEQDSKLGALTRVFGNLRDFGAIMTRGRNTTPNIYGPITLIFKPTVFASMSDIVITKKSIATLAAQWRALAADAAGIVQIVSESTYSYFSSSEWRFAEISCAESRISFEHLDRIVVEPLSSNGNDLYRLVRSELFQHKLGHVPLEVRKYHQAENASRLSALSQYCDRLPEGLPDTNASFASVMDLEEWKSCEDWKRARLKLWARYYYSGTVVECRKRDREFAAFLEEIDATDTRTPCTLCDPGEDSSPAMVRYLDVSDIDDVSKHLQLGNCDYCDSLHFRCRRCGEVEGLINVEGLQRVPCPGECGVIVVYDVGNDFSYSLDVVEAIDEDAMSSAIDARFAERATGAIHDGDYPVGYVELSGLSVDVNASEGIVHFEWSFAADHPSEDFMFDGVVWGRAMFDSDARDSDALTESLVLNELHVEFDLGEPEP